MNQAQVRGGKREAIIEAAVQVFSEKGYHNARMEEIAIAAGIGKGTIYEYFDSKLHLFQAVMENSIQIYYESIVSQDLRNLSFEERLRRLMEGHVLFCQDNRELTRIIFWDAEILDNELKEWVVSLRREKEEHMMGIIHEAIQRGELREIDPYLLTLMLTGVISSVWGPITFDNWTVDPVQLSKDMVDMMMHGVAVRPGHDERNLGDGS